MKFPKNQPELQEKKPGETKSHGWLGLQQEGGWSGTLADNFIILSFAPEIRIQFM